MKKILVAALLISGVVAFALFRTSAPPGPSSILPEKPRSETPRSDLSPSFASTPNPDAAFSTAASSSPLVSGEPKESAVASDLETNPPAGSAKAEQIRAAAFEKISDAAATYDKAAFPIVVPYLRNSDPEIRAAARDALIQIGDPAAAELLRAAAVKTKDPREAVALLDAAEFIELPSATPADQKNTSAANPPPVSTTTLAPPFTAPKKTVTGG